MAKNSITIIPIQVVFGSEIRISTIIHLGFGKSDLVLIRSSTPKSSRGPTELSTHLPSASRFLDDWSLPLTSSGTFKFNLAPSATILQSGCLNSSFSSPNGSTTPSLSIDGVLCSRRKSFSISTTIIASSAASFALTWSSCEIWNHHVEFRLGVPAILSIRSGCPSHIVTVFHSPCGTHVSWRIALVREFS